MHLWSFSTYEKIGSLILGHELMGDKWGLKIDEDPRK